MTTIMPDWESLYRDHFPTLYRALVGVLLDRERVLDALHDAFEEGLRRPPRHDVNVAGWLFRVALRKARRARKGATVPLRIDAPIDTTTQTLAQLEAGRLLGLLTERQRAIVLAYYWLGFTQEEVGQALGVARGSVSATLAQSLKKMRQEGREPLHVR